MCVVNKCQHVTFKRAKQFNVFYDIKIMMENSNTAFSSLFKFSLSKVHLQKSIDLCVSPEASSYFQGYKYKYDTYNSRISPWWYAVCSKMIFILSTDMPLWRQKTNVLHAATPSCPELSTYFLAATNSTWTASFQRWYDWLNSWLNSWLNCWLNHWLTHCFHHRITYSLNRWFNNSLTHSIDNSITDSIIWPPLLTE